MLTRLLLILALGLTGCVHLPSFHKTKKQEAAARAKKPETFSAHEPGQDVAFQSFLGQLRLAIGKHDIPKIASMMTPDFAYVMGKTPAEDRIGEGVFQYWDQNGLWPELELVVKEKFVPNEDYMVAPPQFVIDSENYRGYRAGIRRVNGAWKFAYFVTDPS
jgi:hypothetical protein